MTMTQEGRNLLIKDLCARIPYYTFVEWDDGYAWLSIDRFADIVSNKFGDNWKRPFLRPMSSMTEEEEDEWLKFSDKQTVVEEHTASLDYLNQHHFDYRGLIEKGLAIKAPEGMYS